MMANLRPASCCMPHPGAKNPAKLTLEESWWYATNRLLLIRWYFVCGLQCGSVGTLGASDQMLCARATSTDELYQTHSAGLLVRHNPDGSYSFIRTLSAGMRWAAMMMSTFFTTIWRYVIGWPPTWFCNTWHPWPPQHSSDFQQELKNINRKMSINILNLFYHTSCIFLITFPTTYSSGVYSHVEQ